MAASGLPPAARRYPAGTHIMTEDRHSPSPAGHAVPTFSVVVETENLAVEGPEALQRCLDSLMQGAVDLTRAREVVVTDSGDLDPDGEERIRSRFPFLRILPLPADTGYYEAKMRGADATSGEVVVFCDSDLTVEPGWVDAMLRPFRDRPDIGLVAGETSLTVTGPYTLAH